MKHPYELRHAARKVDAVKVTCVVFGILFLLAGIIMFMIEEAYFIVAISCGIILFLLGGILTGIIEMVQASSIYLEKQTEEWKAQKAQQKAQSPDEADIQ